MPGYGSSACQHASFGFPLRRWRSCVSGRTKKRRIEVFDHQRVQKIACPCLPLGCGCVVGIALPWVRPICGVVEPLCWDLFSPLQLGHGIKMLLLF